MCERAFIRGGWDIKSEKENLMKRKEKSEFRTNEVESREEREKQSNLEKEFDSIDNFVRSLKLDRLGQYKYS